MTDRLVDTSKKHKDYGASARTCDLPGSRQAMEQNEVELQEGQFTNGGFDQSQLENGNKDPEKKGISKNKYTNWKSTNNLC